MKRITLVLIFFNFSSLSFAQKSNPDNKIPILFRLDDIGMCHAVNMAAKEVLETGIPVSMSVMVPCPWFSEGVALLKNYSNVSVGIRSTQNGSNTAGGPCRAPWLFQRWLTLSVISFPHAVNSSAITRNSVRLKQNSVHRLIKHYSQV